MNIVETITFLRPKDKSRNQIEYSTYWEDKHQLFYVQYLSVCSIYKMLPTCRPADKRCKIHSAHLAWLSETQCSACDPWNTLNEEAARASAWSINRRAPTHQEHNICLLVQGSCHADPLALPSRQINALEISRRETIRQLKETSTEYSYSLFWLDYLYKTFLGREMWEIFPKYGPVLYPCGVLVVLLFVLMPVYAGVNCLQIYDFCFLSCHSLIFPYAIKPLIKHLPFCKWKGSKKKK